MTCRRLSVAPAAVLLFVLGGCAETSPNGERAQFLEPPAMGRTLARSGAPIAAPTEAAWPSGEWWRRFRSPELDRIVETALAENQSLKKAMEALRDAEAFSQVQGARLLPFLNADMGMRQGDARSIRGRAGARRQACQKIASQIALRDKTRHDIMRYRQALPSGAVSQQVLQNAMDQLASLDAELHQSRADFQSFEARLGGLTLRAATSSNDRAHIVI